MPPARTAARRLLLAAVLGGGSSCVPPTAEDPSPVPRPPPVEEACDGEDDDGDGVVDEGFPDADGNGRADCLDAPCPRLPGRPERPVAVDSACAGTWAWPEAVVDDPWRITPRWQGRGPQGWTLTEGPPVTPVVLNLTDDDADGDVDRDDQPEVVGVVCRAVGAGRDCATVAWDGATGLTRWEGVAAPAPNQLLAGDLDADGAPEVLTTTTEGNPALVDAGGLREWTAAELPTTNDGAHVAAADLDGDGIPEVLVDDRVYDGASGSLEAALEVPAPHTGGGHAVADLDGDGSAEVIYGDGAFAADGTRRWSTGEASAAAGPWPLVVRGDDGAPVVVVVGSRVATFAVDGTPGPTFPLPAGTASGPPCAGDLDADGTVELVLPTYAPGALTALGLDGTARWSRSIADQEGHAGCVVFDFDGDGTLEVVHSGEAALVVVDGATGVVRASWADAASSTGTETVAVADVDHDGHAELVVAGDGYQGGFAGVAALGHAGAGWSPGGPAWSGPAFGGLDVDPDGRVPSPAPESWREPGLWRGRPVQDGTPPAANLVVEVLGACAVDCTWGPAALSVRVVNRGGRTSAPSVLRVSPADDPDGPPIYARTLDPLPGGTAAASVVIEVPVDRLEGPVRVALDPVEGECAPGDEAVVVDLGC